MEDNKTPPPVAAGEGDKQTPPPSTFETVIPEEFKDRAYLNDLKALPVGPDGFKALFKKLDGAQSLIGKKTGVPAADAPDEEWEKFHSSLRPGKAEEYELESADPEFGKTVKEMFHEAGLSKRQAAKLVAKWDAYVGEKTKAQREADEKLDKEFTELTEKTFGPENAQVLERSKALLQKLTPDNVKPFLVKLPNESLVVLASVMESVHAQYIKEDKIGGGDGAGGGATDVASLREEAQKLQASPEWKDAWHPKHEEVKRKVNDIYTTIGRLSSGGKK